MAGPSSKSRTALMVGCALTAAAAVAWLKLYYARRRRELAQVHKALLGEAGAPAWEWQGEAPLRVAPRGELAGLRLWQCICTPLHPAH